MTAMAILSADEESTDERAIYAHNIVSLSEHTDLIAGLRYQETKKTGVLGQLFGRGAYAARQAPFFVVSSWDPPRQHDKWDAFSGTLKLRHSFTDDITVYGGFDRGYKAGGFNVTKSASATSNPDGFIVVDPFEEQTADSVELGVKAYFFDRSLRVNVNVFHQIYDDFQVEVPDSVGPGNLVLNAAKLKSSGFELEFAWRVTDRLSFDGDLSYIDARWKSFENSACNAMQLRGLAGGCVNNRQDLSGKRFHGNRPWSSNLSATWEGDFGSIGTWHLRGEVLYRDDVIGTPDHDPRAHDDDYVLLNASLNLRIDRWSLTLWAKNLGDAQYTTLFTLARDGSGAGYGMLSTPEDGRRVGITAQYEF